MEDKKLTPQESLDVITRMINASKQRIALPDLRVSLVWAGLSIATATVVLIASLVAYTPWINLLWLVIPFIGLPLTFHLGRGRNARPAAKTPIDLISDGIWKIVGMVAIMLGIVCVVFSIMGYSAVWLAMFYFAFIVVGFAAAMQGVVLREDSYVFGGVFSIVAGFVLVALNLCNVPLLIVWVLPLYIVCFMLMFIVPACIIGRKIKSAGR